MKFYYYLFFFAIIFCGKAIAQAPVMNSIIGSNIVCSSPAVPSGFSTSASNSPTSYNWIVSPAAGVSIGTPNLANTTISFPHTNATFTVYCTATNSSGTSAPVQFTVNVFETPTVTFSGANNFCQGSSTNLQASSTILAASTTISYNWAPNTGLNTSTGPFVNAAPAASTIYSVTGTIGLCSNTSTILITVNPTPTINASVFPSMICAGNSSTLTISGNAISYSLNSVSSPTMVIVSPTGTTNYIVTGFNGLCTYSINVPVNVIFPPVIIVASNPTLICSGNSATLSISGTPASYSLNSVSTSTSIVISPTTTTIYTITGVAGPGCSATQYYTQNVQSCVGIRENSVSSYSKLSIYPNPSNGQFVIKSNVYQLAKIISETGQIIKQIEIYPDLENKITGLKNGIYFIITEATRTKFIVAE